jgi:AcrR family transcriptional regulator
MLGRMPNRRVASPAEPGVDDRAPSAAGRRPLQGSTRGRILTASERLFAEQGFKNVSMPMIAEASGITAGAIYKHFESKADLFFEVVRRAVHSAPMGPAPDAATDLPRVVATYTTRRLKLLRQLAIEVHSASGRHPKVRRLLKQSLDQRIAQLREGLAGAQQTGKLDPTVDPELLSFALLVFIMGLMHMETLVPQFVGDPRWHDFVQDRVATLIGVREPG